MIVSAMAGGFPHATPPFHHTFAPLGDRPQRRLARRLLLQLELWQRGPAIEALRGKLETRFAARASLFASGRQALLALLQAMDLPAGGEVIVQAYTCVVVPNAIHAAGGVAVYADIEREALSMDIASVEAAITPKTRAVICQHTFGIPADTQSLRQLCDRHGLLLIEDCAHVLPDDRGPEAIGKHGDVLLLSFGRDKAVSAVTGGALLSRRPDLSAKLQAREETASDLHRWTICRLLLYPLLYHLARPLYGIGMGKALLLLFQKLRLLLPIVTDGEKRGSMPRLLHKFPNACAALALDQLRRLQAINDHRRMLTRLYLDEGKKRGWPLLAGVRSDLPLQKFPLFTKGAERIRRALKRKNIHLHDGWTGCVVCPAGIDLPETGYELGKDPEAEAACEEIITLPTHPIMTEGMARKLVEIVDAHFKEQNPLPAAVHSAR